MLFCCCCFSRLLGYVAFRAARGTILPAGSAAGQERGEKRQCRGGPGPSFGYSWHLLLVHSGSPRGQRGGCSQLSRGLKRLVD